LPSNQRATPIVIDTNVALDWLLFDDPMVRPIAAAVEAGRLSWLACPSMRLEFLNVAHRSKLVSRRSAEPLSLLAAWDAKVSMRTAPQPVPQPRLRCADRDDQVFVDLAVEQQARWLFTRDNALLHLATAALAISGVLVVRPTAFIET
jgi:uncharacterized protein